MTRSIARGSDGYRLEPPPWLPGIGSVPSFRPGAMHLMARVDNPRALELYERAGFASPPRAFLTKRLP